MPVTADVEICLVEDDQARKSLALYRREVYCDVVHFLLFAAWELDGHRDYWS